MNIKTLKLINHTLAIFALHQYITLKMSAGEIGELDNFDEMWPKIKKDLPKLMQVGLKPLPKRMKPFDISKFR